MTFRWLDGLIVLLIYILDVFDISDSVTMTVKAVMNFGAQQYLFK